MICYLEPDPNGGICLVCLTKEQAIKDARKVWESHKAKRSDLPELTDEEALVEFTIVHWAWECSKITMEDAPDGVIVKEVIP